MPKLLTRLIAILLVFCLVADPVTASVTASIPSIPLQAQAPSAVFSGQAVPAPLEWAPHFVGSIGRALRRMAGRARSVPSIATLENDPERFPDVDGYAYLSGVLIALAAGIPARMILGLGGPAGLANAAPPEVMASSLYLGIGLHLVGGLLFSSSDPGHTRQDAPHLDLNQILSTRAFFLKRTARNKNVGLQLQTIPDNLWIDGRHNLKTTSPNIESIDDAILDALKQTPPGGMIYVVLRREGKDAIIEVSSSHSRHTNATRFPIIRIGPEKPQPWKIGLRDALAFLLPLLIPAAALGAAWALTYLLPGNLPAAGTTEHLAILKSAGSTLLGSAMLFRMAQVMFSPSNGASGPGANDTPGSEKLRFKLQQKVSGPNGNGVVIGIEPHYAMPDGKSGVRIEIKLEGGEKIKYAAYSFDQLPVNARGEAGKGSPIPREQGDIEGGLQRFISFIEGVIQTVHSLDRRAPGIGRQDEMLRAFSENVRRTVTDLPLEQRGAAVRRLEDLEDALGGFGILLAVYNLNDLLSWISSDSAGKLNTSHQEFASILLNIRENRKTVKIESILGSLKKTEYRAAFPVLWQLLYRKNIKDKVWDNAQPERELLERSGVDLSKLINLNNGAHVKRVLTEVRTEGSLKDSLSQDLLKATGHSLQELDAHPELTGIYLDEIAEVLGASLERRKRQLQNVPAKVAKIGLWLAALTFRKGKGVEFRISPRTLEELHYGDATGDCTATVEHTLPNVTGRMFWTVPRWIADQTHLILTQYLDGQLYAKYNLVLTQDEENRISLYVHAVEISARAAAGSRVFFDEDTRLKMLHQGFRKIRAIASLARIKKLYILPESNTKWVRDHIRTNSYALNEPIRLRKVGRAEVAGRFVMTYAGVFIEPKIFIQGFNEEIHDVFFGEEEAYAYMMGEASVPFEPREIEDDPPYDHVAFVLTDHARNSLLQQGRLAENASEILYDLLIDAFVQNIRSENEEMNDVSARIKLLQVPSDQSEVFSQKLVEALRNLENAGSALEAYFDKEMPLDELTEELEDLGYPVEVIQNVVGIINPEENHPSPSEALKVSPTAAGSAGFKLDMWASLLESSDIGDQIKAMEAFRTAASPEQLQPFVPRFVELAKRHAETLVHLGLFGTNWPAHNALQAAMLSLEASRAIEPIVDLMLDSENVDLWHWGAHILADLGAVERLRWLALSEKAKKEPGFENEVTWSLTNIVMRERLNQKLIDLLTRRLKQLMSIVWAILIPAAALATALGIAWVLIPGMHATLPPELTNAVPPKVMASSLFLGAGFLHWAGRLLASPNDPSGSGDRAPENRVQSFYLQGPARERMLELTRGVLERPQDWRAGAEELQKSFGYEVAVPLDAPPIKWLFTSDTPLERLLVQLGFDREVFTPLHKPDENKEGTGVDRLRLIAYELLVNRSHPKVPVLVLAREIQQDGVPGVEIIARNLGTGFQESIEWSVQEYQTTSVGELRGRGYRTILSATEGGRGTVTIETNGRRVVFGPKGVVLESGPSDIGPEVLVTVRRLAPAGAGAPSDPSPGKNEQRSLTNGFPRRPSGIQVDPLMNPLQSRRQFRGTGEDLFATGSQVRHMTNQGPAGPIARGPGKEKGSPKYKGWLTVPEAATQLQRDYGTFRAFVRGEKSKRPGDIVDVEGTRRLRPSYVKELQKTLRPARVPGYGTLAELMESAGVAPTTLSLLDRAIKRGDPDIQPDQRASRHNRNHLYKLDRGQFDEDLLEAVRKYDEGFSETLSVSEVARKIGVTRSRLNDAVWTYVYDRVKQAGVAKAAKEFGIPESALAASSDFFKEKEPHARRLLPDKVIARGAKIYFRFDKSSVESIRQDFQPFRPAGYGTAQQLAQAAGVDPKHYAALREAIRRGDSELQPDLPATTENPNHQYKLIRGKFNARLLEAVRRKYGEDLSDYLSLQVLARRLGRPLSTLSSWVLAYLFDVVDRASPDQAAKKSGFPRSAFARAIAAFGASPRQPRLKPDKIKASGKRLVSYFKKGREKSIEKDLAEQTAALEKKKRAGLFRTIIASVLLMVSSFASAETVQRVPSRTAGRPPVESVRSPAAGLLPGAGGQVQASPIERVRPYLNWLEKMRLPGSPLVRSYEVPDQPDAALAQVDPAAQAYFRKGIANTYDQALAVIDYVATNNRARAFEILKYFSDRRTIPTKSNLEGNVISGEAIWISGIAAAQFTEKFGADPIVNGLMDDVDRYTQEMQQPDGRILGGPGLPWSSTEHNLDALAYLTMRYKQTNRPQIRTMRDNVARWLVQAYKTTGGTYLPRGHNDPMYATDVQAWGVLVLTGVQQTDPEFFKQSGLETINLRGLVQAADQNALATATFRRPNGTTVQVRGYRFGREANSPVSVGWMLQMALAKKTLGDMTGANEIVANADRTRIDDGRGSASLAYAVTPGKTFPDGWTATTFPSLESVSWRMYFDLNWNPLNLGGSLPPPRAADQRFPERDTAPSSAATALAQWMGSSSKLAGVMAYISRPSKQGFFLNRKGRLPPLPNLTCLRAA